jgi:peroxiredoxin
MEIPMKRFGKVTAGLMTAMAMALVMAMPSPASADDKVKAKVGEKAPDFELTDVVTGEAVRLSDFRGEKIVVVTFQSMTCPWDSLHADRGYQPILSKLAEEKAEHNVQFLAINSNVTESVEQLASHVQSYPIPYPVLKDPGNQVADIYGGRTTPHFYVIDKEGVLRYNGGFEKAPGSPAQVGQMDEQYLVPVLQALIAGEEPPVTNTVPRGCSIKRG